MSGFTKSTAQVSVQTLANTLQQAVQNKSKAHPFFRSGIFNAGKWLGSWEKMQSKGCSNGDAALMAAFLPYEFSTTQSSRWPWQERTGFLSTKNTKRWIQGLYDLDSQATVYVDLIPGLVEWIADVYNYIPRDMWSMAARLLARFYHSSKQLFKQVQSADSEVIPDQFFFHHVDEKLHTLFDFSTPSKTKGAIRTVFDSGLSDDEANSAYGSHSHVHRHGLYLLFQIAMVDDGWHDTVFDTTKKKFQKHIDKINDKSCLSVLRTAQLEICYQTDVSRHFDWTVLNGLGIDGIQQVSAFPLPSIIVAAQDWKPETEKLIRQKVLKIRALKSNIQLVTQLLDVNRRHAYCNALPLFQDVEGWVCSVGVTAKWGEFSYDYLILWLDQLHPFNISSPLMKRIQDVVNMTPEEQRERLMYCLRLFFETDLYALCTTNQRKEAFFDLWYLSDPQREAVTFEGGFLMTHVLRLVKDSVFENVEGLQTNMLNFVLNVIPKQEVGKSKHTRLLLLLSVLLHRQLLKVHDGELAECIRGGMLSELLISKTTSTLIQDGDLKQRDKMYVCASPIAVWLLNTKAFKGYQTPITFQIIQSFLMGCSTPTARFVFFWRLGLYQPSVDFYKIFAKNLFFPFHLLNASIQYTQTDWYTICNQLIDYVPNQKFLKPEPVDKSIDTQHQSETIFSIGSVDAMAKTVQDFNNLWSNILEGNRQIVLRAGVSWPNVEVETMIDNWQAWMKATPPENHLEFGESLVVLDRFFTALQTVLSNIVHDVDVQSLINMLTQFKEVCTDLETGTEVNLDEELAVLNTFDSQALVERGPVEFSFLYKTVVDKIKTVLNQVIDTEKQFLEWDKEIQSAHVSFSKLKQYFSGNAGYWKHAGKIFETTSVEQFVSQAWIDNLPYQSDWTVNQFAQGLSTFESVFDGYAKDPKRPYEVMTQKILEQPKKLGRLYSPLLNVIHHRIQELTQQSTKMSDGEQSVLVEHKRQSNDNKMEAVDTTLRDQGLHGLANKFSKGQVTSFGGTIVRFALNHGLSSFVAAVVSLTLLLDFGGSLLNLYSDNIVASLVSVVAALAFAFGYPYAAKHRGMGVSLKDSIQNIVPSFIVSVVMSYGLTLIWTIADGEASFGLPAVLLMLFFTTIVKAATDGAFDADGE